MTIRGTDELELQLSKLADPEIAKDVVWAGAQPIADEIRKSIEALPEDSFRKLKGDEKFNGVPRQQKQDLLNSLGITPPDISHDGNTNAKIGFDGYGSYPTKKYPKGVPNALLARAVESGSTVRKKTPFVRLTVNRIKNKSINAMQVKLDEKIYAITKKG